MIPAPGWKSLQRKHELCICGLQHLSSGQESGVLQTDSIQSVNNCTAALSWYRMH